jgi:hypothetical protein
VLSEIITYAPGGIIPILTDIEMKFCPASA